MKKPNFFIVGAARSGTTTLYYTLKEHPDIFMSFHKEPGFFTENWGTIKTEDWTTYLSLFNGAKDEKIIGEASTVYLYSTDAAMRIKTGIQNPKILIQLRDPVERAISEYKLRVSKGQEDLDFAAALAIEEQRIEEGKKHGYHYFNKGLYYKQVKRFYDHFNKNQILVTTFEDFQKRPRCILESIYNFLEVDPKYIPQEVRRYNAGKKVKLLCLEKLLTGDSWLKKCLKLVIPREIRSKLSHKIRTDLNISSSVELNVRISEFEKKELREKYAQDIKKLERLLERDFSPWLP